MDDSLSEVAAEFEKDFETQTKEAESTDKPGTSLEPLTKKSTTPFSLLVNPKQRGNPLLKSIRNIIWEYDDIVPDYQMGRSVCALFLSLRYHNLNPDYIHERLKLLGNSYELRVLLVQIDIPDPHHALKHLTRICILADMTLILAWSPEEAGKIIEAYKIYENKPADKLMGKTESSSYIRIIQALTSIKSVNKTDAMVLINKFRTLEGILKATELQISLCPGFGALKAKRVYSTLHENFSR
ncbi:Binding domain of DNA repair protein Ercc1 (rad10/Swi10) [Popillia japonica]|uniref:DNA excision repair protein ERCC-1 n=1 Tax=Popillia japonica TaxID=7064 RepID=A0AAW1IET7_POPJA